MSETKKEKGDEYPILERYHQGYSISEISKETGVSIPTVTKRLRENGIRIDKHERPPKVCLPSSAISHVYPYNLLVDMIEKNMLECSGKENAEDIFYRVYIPDVMDAIDFLEPQRKWILENKFRNGLSNQNIGAMLGCTREYVRQSLTDAEQQIGTYLSKNMMATNLEVKKEIHESLVSEYKNEYMTKNKILSDETFAALPIDCIGSSVCPLNIISILKHNYGVRVYGDMAKIHYQDLCYDKHIGKEMADGLVRNFQRIGIGIDMSDSKKGEKVADSGLSSRAQRALAKHNVTYISQEMSGYNFASMKGVGEKLSREITDCCKSMV